MSQSTENKVQRARRNKNLILAAPAMDLILRLVQCGRAAFDVTTYGFRFNGLRYSARDGDWNGLLAVIGWDNARAALAKAGVQ